MGRFIKLTRENGQPVFVAVDNIYFATIEDGVTIISQGNGELGLNVTESLEDVIATLKEY